MIPEEAWIIRRIFREYLDGYSPKHIVERLIADGVDGTKITRKGYKIERIWSTAGIKGILSNEKYAGDCLLQKFYTVDFLTKKVAPNHGERPQYYVEDGHDPVVPKGIFLQVQAERERRRFHGPEFRYVHGIGLSGKIFCEDCGLPFRRKDDHGYKYWYCESGRKSRHPDSECHNGRIREEKLQEIVIAAFNQLPEHEQDLMHLQARVRVMGIDKADEMLKQIDGEIESTTGEEQERLRVQRHEIAEQRTVYADKDVQIRSLLDRIAAIRGVKTPFELDRAGKCDDPEEFFRLTRTVYPAGPVREFSDDDARKFIEKVVLGEKITVVFKAGISMEFDR